MALAIREAPHAAPTDGAYPLTAGVPLTVPVTPERLALLRVESADPHRAHELSILFTRVAESRWIVGDPEGAITTDDLQSEEVIPL